MSDSMSRRGFLGVCAAASGVALGAGGAPGPTGDQENTEATERDRQPAKKSKPFKIFMLWDMEGASGLFRREQTWFWDQGVSPEVAAEGRDLLAADVRSAVRAALDAGVDQLIVCDTHHGGGNIRLDQLPPDPRVTCLGKSIGPEGGKVRWMPGLDSTVDGFMLMAHHAKAGTEGAFLPHTQNGPWADFQINGMSVGEIGIETCYAGHWGVPLALVQGDEAACREAREQFPGVVTAAVKHAVDHDRCAGLDAEAARRLTASKIAEAIRKCRSGQFKPFHPTLPMNIRLRLSTPEAARNAVRKSGGRAVDEYTVEAEVGRQCDVLKWLTGTGLDMVEPR